MMRVAVFLIFIFSLFLTRMSHAQSTYRLPPQEVVDILDAPPEPSVAFSPNGQWRLLIEHDAMPGIAALARRMLQLAGMRIDPAANAEFQIDYAKGLVLQAQNGARSTRLPLPQSTRIGQISWSHLSDRFIYTLVTDRGTELWIATVDEPASPRRLTDRLSTVMGVPDWMPDGKQILCQLVPQSRGPEPTPPALPSGPNIQESVGNTSPTRTYQDLLTNPYDEALFKYYATAQLARIDAAGKTTQISLPAIFGSVRPAPDGQHLLVTTIHEPFSYLLTYQSFPKKIAVWDLTGTPLYQVAEVPLEENIPIEGVRTGPRNVRWAASQPATLFWNEALDGGDPRKPAPHRDRLISISAPFQSPPQELLKTEHRAMGLSFFRDPQRLATTEFDRDRRWVRTLLHHLDQPATPPQVLDDRSVRDQYADPGDMLSVHNDSGYRVVLQDGDSVFLRGQGATPEGLRPFLDRHNLQTLQKDRLWQCDTGEFESVLLIATLQPDAKPSIITRHESPNSPPNYRLRDLQTGKTDRLTQFSDPTPQIRAIQKQIVTYQRADGVTLSATLYLPAGYTTGQRLPLIVWAYPREFNDAGTAGQIASSPWQFTRMPAASHLILLTQGYAIMDAATMPAIGDPETMNDTFIDQIVSSAQAAIDKAVEMGVADRNRVGVGGHSYGAFMTANLMAHSDLFRAGVARSGAYNRTLTPFGFQSERRPLWEAKEIYSKLSPFMHADQINEPLLLIHGENDSNAGTFPLQSQRLYQAIKGNGGTVRLVLLPHESHGYRARESVLHTQAETIEWFNKYVRDAKVAGAK